ncbi:MAG TPA: FkbM family methyltransferase, partial [Methylomirabilota bacterium]|nr:FkbM family methyltransferase [Methylomirabilota bacterium]
MGHPFQDKCYIRPAQHDQSPIEQHEWCWPKGDTGCWEGPLLNWNQEHSQKWFAHVKKFDVAVQAGGGCGMYPKMLAEKFKLVYAFEPSPISFYCLVNNCQMDNVLKFNCALADVHARGTVDVCESNVGANTVRRNPQGLVQIIPLDFFNLDALDLLALDVEGAEPLVLQGAKTTIMRFSPVIVAEQGNRN